MKKIMVRILSCILAMTVLFTSIPINVFASENQELKSSEQQNSEESTLEYQPNGGAFFQEYTPPAFYPIEALPDSQITKAGYEFGGWYDNEELQGEALTQVPANTYVGNVVLYAKWIPQYYYVDIPATADANGGNMNVTVKGGGFYPEDKATVAVSSENDWNLKDGSQSVKYQFSKEESILENQSTVAEL